MPCPCCGGRMTIIETFERWQQPRAPPRAPPPTRSPCRDPARPAPTLRRNPLVPAKGPTHARRQNHGEATGYKPRRSAELLSVCRKARLVRSPPSPSRRWRHQRHGQAKHQIPIDLARGPRVRTWAVFVRLTASENLHRCCRSWPPLWTPKADTRRARLAARTTRA